MTNYWCVLTSIGTAVVSWFVTSRIKSLDKLNDNITLIKKDADELAKSGSLYWTPAPTREDRMGLVIEISYKYNNLSDQIDGLKKYTKKNSSETGKAVNDLYIAITGGSYQCTTFQPSKATIEEIKVCRSKLNDELNKITIQWF